MFLAIVVCLLSGAPARGEEPAVALVVYTNGRLVPGNVLIERGLRSALGGSKTRPVNLFGEFLDYPEFSGAAHEDNLVRYLREKYERRRPDVIIAVSREAFDFVLRHRDGLFPGVPVVHVSVYKPYLDANPVLPADVVGVPIEYDPAGTIEQALRWHRSARRLVIVNGTSARDRDWETQLRALAPRFEGRVEVEFLTVQSVATLHQRLASLDPGSVIFTFGFYHGVDGALTTPGESVKDMARVATAPIYVPITSSIGQGAVGGRVPDFEAMGSRAGQTVLDLVAGRAPATLALPRITPNHMTIDWRQANRFGVADSQVPDDAVVLFKPPTFWQAYRDQAIAIAVVVLLQAGLITALLFERRRRRDAEVAVQQQRSELAHASRLSIAGEMTASIAHEINQPLGAILASADAAELLLQSGVDRREDLLRIIGRIRRDDLRASDVIRRLRGLLARHGTEHEAVEVGPVIDEVAKLLETEARRRSVVLAVEALPGAALVLGDAVQIQQVLINLVLNAMDAVAELPADRRTVTIAAEARAERITISVQDRGHGIDGEHLPKIFESFFSTKHRGMGLGLSIARTIVDSHGGRISAANMASGGAVFRVELPAAAGVALAAQAMSA